MSAIDFRFTGGLQQSVGKRDLAPPLLAECTNVVWEKGNLIRRRDGFGEAGAGATLAGSTRGPHALASVGGQLLATGSDGTHVDQVYAGSPEYLDTVGAPTLSGSGPFIGLSAYLGVDETPTSPTPITDCDMAVGSSYRLLVWASDSSVTLELQTLDGVRVWRRTVVENAVDAGVRTLFYGTDFFVCFNDDDALKFFSFTPSDTPLSSVTLGTLATLKASTSAWDFTRTPNGIAWIAQTGSNVEYKVGGNSAVTVGAPPIGDATWARISYAGSKYHLAYADGDGTLKGAVGSATALDVAEATITLSVTEGDVIGVDADTCIVLANNGSRVISRAYEYSTATVRSTTLVTGRPVSRLLISGGDVYVWLMSVPGPTATTIAVNARVLYRLGTEAELSDVSAASTTEPTPLAIAHQGATTTVESSRLPSLLESSKGLVSLVPEVFSVDSSDAALRRASVVEVHALTDGDYSRSVAVLGGVALLSGAYPRYTDGAALSLPVATVPVPDVSSSGSGGTIAAGSYGIRVTYEWYMGGVRFQTGASAAESKTTTGSTSKVDVEVRPSYHTEGVYVVVWMTVAGGETYYRAGEAELASDAATTVTITSVASLTDNEQLYSNSEPDRYAPPSLECVGVAGRRLWGGHGRRVYYSQPLGATGDAPQFCAQLFYEELADTVTAIGEVDEQAVVFTADRTFVFRGLGPDRVGSGAWQVDEISGEIGCVDQRSVARTDRGLYFLSRRGIEFLPTGGRSVQFVGAAVEDEVATRPVCGASAVDAERQLVLFSMTPARDPVNENLNDGSDPEPSGGRLLAVDTENGAWSSWQAFGTDQYGNSVPGLVSHEGELLCGYDYFEPIVYRYGADLDANSQTGSAETPATYDHEAIVRTGELRPSGLTGEGQFAGIRAVGEIGGAGQVTPLQMRVSFDQCGRFNPAAPNATTETVTWFAGGSSDPLVGLTGRETGMPWERQYMPSVSRRTSLSVQMTWSGEGDCLRLYGFSAEYTADGRQQRMGATRSK